MNQINISAIILEFSENEKFFIFDSKCKNPLNDSIQFEYKTQRWKDTSKKTNSGTIQIKFTDDSFIISLKENINYNWKYDTDLNCNHIVIQSPLESQRNDMFSYQIIDNFISGKLKVINYSGSSYIQFNDRRIEIEITPAKFSQKDYQDITLDISNFCSQLLLDWASPSELKYELNEKRSFELIIEQFGYLKSKMNKNSLDSIFDSILRNPHSSVSYDNDYFDESSIGNSNFYKDPYYFSKEWFKVPKNNNFNINGYLPTSISNELAIESFDTLPNRFIKSALEYFIDICYTVEMGKTSSSYRLDAIELRERLEILVSYQIFRDLKKSNINENNHPVLRKRDGYRDILDIYQLMQNSVSLSWDDHKELFSITTIGIDTLYEYWIYIKLYELLNSFNFKPFQNNKSPNNFILISSDRMKIRLKEGQETLSVFLSKEFSIRIHFYYNRMFIKNNNYKQDNKERYQPINGSYTRSFRPDYTIVILPYSEFENSTAYEDDCSNSGNISYIHLDAKYRVDDYQTIFDSENETNQSIKNEERNYIYKNADLYKIHTYNEAIRKTIGSYILYPGNRSFQFKKYHEILPGVGAFSMLPGEEHNELKVFLKEIFIHQSSKYSQNYRMQYYIHDTISKNPDIITHKYDQYLNVKDSPPLDIYIIYTNRNGIDFELISKNIFFIPAIIDSNPIQYPSRFFICSKFLGNDYDSKISYLGNILSIELKSSSDIMNIYPSKSLIKNSFYYQINLENLMNFPFHLNEKELTLEVINGVQLSKILSDYYNNLE